MIRPAIVLTAAPLLLNACASPDDSSRSAIVRDSAGVRIAENSSGASGERWRLQLPAVLQIGRGEGKGDGPDLFGSVRRAIRLVNGDVAVADELALEIRVFDEDGGHRRTFGRRGEGPGEFTNLTLIGELAGDTIAVIDNLGERVSLFTSAGAFARSFPLPRLPGASAPNAIGWLEDGTLMIQTSSRSPSRDTRAQSTILVYAVDRHGQILGTLGEFPNTRLGRNGYGLGFGSRAQLAVGGGLVWYGHSGDFALFAYDRMGSARRIVRLDRTPKPVTEEEIAESKAKVEEGLRGRSGPAVRRILDTEFASEHPLHGRILADEGGGLWVERYRSDLIEDGGPREWDVFDAEGRLAGHLTTPENLRISDIGREFVLAIHSDSLGVNTVRMYRLDRD